MIENHKLAVTWLEGYVYAYIFYCNWRSLSASITRGEFDLFVGVGIMICLTSL